MGRERERGGSEQKGTEMNRGKGSEHKERKTNIERTTCTGERSEQRDREANRGKVNGRGK